MTTNRIIFVMVLCAIVIPVFALPGLKLPMPEFAKIAGWINSDSLTKKSLQGSVVLIDFWTYSCINCVRTLPHLQEWHQRYKDAGLVVVGVHSPEFAFEKIIGNVQSAVKRFGLTYPIALDSSMATWNNYSNRYWPAKYLFDKDQRLIWYHFGEGKYAVFENKIREALGLRAKPIKSKPREHKATQTHETYLGYGRGKNLARGYLRYGPRNYSFSKNLAQDHWDLSGRWNFYYEKVVAEKPGSKLRLHFLAKEVYVVIGGPLGATVQVQSGSKKSTITIDGHRMYHVFSQKSFKSGILQLTVDKDVELYAFTFGS